MEHNVVPRNLKIHVNLHTALMGVGGHGIPYTAFLQNGHAHGQLAGLKHIRMDELVNHALIRCLRSAARPLGSLLNGDVGSGKGCVGRCAYHIELSWIGSVLA